MNLHPWKCFGASMMPLKTWSSWLQVWLCVTGKVTAGRNLLWWGKCTQHNMFQVALCWLFDHDSTRSFSERFCRTLYFCWPCVDPFFSFFLFFFFLMLLLLRPSVPVMRESLQIFSSTLLLMLGSMADELTGWRTFMFSIHTSSSSGTWHNKFRAAAQLVLKSAVLVQKMRVEMEISVFEHRSMFLPSDSLVLFESELQSHFKCIFDTL